MNKFSYNFCSIGSLGLLLLLSTTAAQAQDAAEEARKEATRQATRQISMAIGRRVTTSEAGITGPMAGAAQTATGGAFNLWASPNYTSIEFDGFDVDLDLYQFVGGADTRVGDFFFGASGTYTRADVNSRRNIIDFGGDTYSVSPYASYVFNKNVFATAIAGYSRSTLEVVPGDFDSNTLFTDISLNGLLPVDNFILSGKVGHRFSYSAAENPGRGSPQRVDQDDWLNTYYMTGEAWYKWDRFFPYFSATWEHADPEDAPDDQDSVFTRVGVQYNVVDNFTMGVAYTTELTGWTDRQEIRYNQASMDFRLSF